MLYRHTLGSTSHLLHECTVGQSFVGPERSELQIHTLFSPAFCFFSRLFSIYQYTKISKMSNLW